MSAQLPKSVKVGGHTYRVLFPYGFRERTDLAGQTDHQLLEMRIAEVDSSGNVRAPTTVEETFIHELLHAVDRVYNGHSLSEEQVMRLSEGLYQTLKDSGLLALQPPEA